jgi:hypothetical protein
VIKKKKKKEKVKTQLVESFSGGVVVPLER